MVELETVLTATTSTEEDTERTVLFAPVFVQPHMHFTRSGMQRAEPIQLSLGSVRFKNASSMCKHCWLYCHLDGDAWLGQQGLQHL